MTTKLPAGLVDRNAVLAAIEALPAVMPNQGTVKHDDALAAVCIIEEMLDPIGQLPDAPKPWDDWRDQVGIGELREFVLSTLAPAANAAWEKAYAAYEHQCAEARVKGQPEPVEPGSFDYDFIPSWIRVAVDWSDVRAGPRVLGKR